MAVSTAHHRGKGLVLELECLSRSSYWPSTCPNRESMFVKCLPFRFKIGFSYQMSFHMNRGQRNVDVNLSIGFLISLHNTFRSIHRSSWLAPQVVRCFASGQSRNTEEERNMVNHKPTSLSQI